MVLSFPVFRAPSRVRAVTKEGLSFGDEDVADVKKREKHYNKIFTPLAEHLKTLFKGKISKVFSASSFERQHGGVEHESVVPMLKHMVGL